MRNPHAPEGSQFYLDGLFFKFGRHGKLFRHGGEDWMLTTKTKQEVLRWGVPLTPHAIEMQRKDKD